MGMIFEYLEDHEGYAVRRVPDDRLTSTRTRDTAAFDAYVGAWSCGWIAFDHHPPTEAGCRAAEDEWEYAHARPLLAAAVPARITELVDNLREDVAELAHDRPLARRPPAHCVVRPHPAADQDWRAAPPPRHSRSCRTRTRSVAVGGGTRRAGVRHDEAP
jgi:hypothetical protein